MSRVVLRPGASQDITVAATHAESATAFQAATRMVRMVSTTACYVAIGANPVAAKPGGMRLAPNFPETFHVNTGEKVSVIQDAAGGTLTLTEMSS